MQAGFAGQHKIFQFVASINNLVTLYMYTCPQLPAWSCGCSSKQQPRRTTGNCLHTALYLQRTTEMKTGEDTTHTITRAADVESDHVAHSTHGMVQSG